MKATIGLAALATSASAIMIPSTVSLPVSDLSHTVTDPQSQILKVDCPGCQLAQHDAAGRLTWTHGVENSLVLNISVGEAPETLELNGVRFYPPVMSSFAIENPVPYIPQVPADMSMTDIRKNKDELAKNALRLTSWSFQAGHAQTVSESGEELFTIHLQLNALERQPISIPDITITAMKNTDAELMIIKIETQDKDTVEKEQCKEWPILCKWRNIVNDKLSGFKGIHGFGKPPCANGKRPFGFHPHTEEDSKPEHGIGRPGWKHHGPPGKGHHGGRPWGHHGWHHPHGHMHHHSRLHRAFHVIGRVMLTVFVPILVGVAAGMITYLLCMLLGAVFAAVYLKIRGRKARYQAVALEEADVDGNEETPRYSLENDGFKDEEVVMEAPPEYVEKE